MYIPKFFKIEELVYPELFNQYNGQNILWKAFDDRMLRTLDLLRERFGPMTINNWRINGPRKESGLRNMTTTTGAALSAHKFGRAADIIFKNISAQEVRSEMRRIGCFKENVLNGDPKFEPYKLIHRIEEMPNMGWFHFDITNDYNTNGSIKVIAG